MVFLNQTKIWYLKSTNWDTNRGFTLYITFSVNTTNHYYSDFIYHSQDYPKLKKWVMRKEDYDKYLEEDKEEKVDVYFTDTGKGSLLWTPPETAYSRFLDRRINKENDYVVYEHPLFSYNEKTNIFTFHEAITETPTTIGALQELKLIKNEVVLPNYSSVLELYLLNCIKTLDSFWD